MADMKIPVALVFAMAVQLVGLVWYISNIVHDIEHLQGQVSAQQDIINLLNDDIEWFDPQDINSIENLIIKKANIT